MESRETRKILENFFAAMDRGDGDAIFAALSPSVVFEIRRNEWNSVVDYVGTYTGLDAVAGAFQVRGETTEPLGSELRELVVEGSTAYARLWDKAVHSRTQVPFEVEVCHRLELDEQGRIALWNVYFDPTPEIASFGADASELLLAAVRQGDKEAIATHLGHGAD
ncbi:nuclear transport factor 2 family protein, partial [Streptomyces sp. NPDC059009]|uniref:nuclear transport factor 2 family protein n=1 Tax=Streptomyces sp. NPDC059009 TaxID=3346694 RepID=UPI0036B82F6C